MMMMIKFATIACVLSLLETYYVEARTFTIQNNCPFTIWPAYFTNPDSPAQISAPTGWEAGQSSSITLTVPDGWAGRFWGRTGCDFSIQGPTSCRTGGCNGGLLCDSSTGTGVPPATLAEFKLNGDQNQDFYDISNVDGSSLPVRISNNKGCREAGCNTDLNAGCPDDRLKVRDADGVTIGCLSACQANIDGNREDSANCCTGSHNTPETCPASGVQFYDYFKTNCPDAYAYAYDEASQSSLFVCPVADPADYTVTFCP